MVQYSHVRGSLKPKRRNVISKALAKLSPRSFSERRNYERFVAEPVDPDSICFTNLPCEIRLMIWRACLESRVVSISAHPTRIWASDWRSYRPAISSVHATMPLTLSVNRESRYETLLHYPDLIQNPAIFRDPVYFNPKLDKLAIHVLYHRRREWRLADQCLCRSIRILADIGKASTSMCKMVRFLMSPALCNTCKLYKTLFPPYFEIMHEFQELKTIVYQSPNVNETMILNNISEDGSCAMRKPVWKAVVTMEDFEDDNWRVTRTDDRDIPLLYQQRRLGRFKNLFRGRFVRIFICNSA